MLKQLLCLHVSQWGVRNCNEWIGLTPIPFLVGNVAPNKSRVECKVCYSTHVYIVLCHVCIIYVHYTFPRMSRTCIHLGVHDHLVLNDTYRESLDMAYQCVAREVM